VTLGCGEAATLGIQCPINQMQLYGKNKPLDYDLSVRQSKLLVERLILRLTG
jgi:hypothetical protein